MEESLKDLNVNFEKVIAENIKRPEAKTDIDICVPLKASVPEGNKRHTPSVPEKREGRYAQGSSGVYRSASPAWKARSPTG